MDSHGVFRCAEVTFATLLYIVAWSDVSILTNHLDWVQYHVIPFSLIAAHCGAVVSLANVVALRFGRLDSALGLQRLTDRRSEKLTVATLVPMISAATWISTGTPSYLAGIPNIYFAFGYVSGNVLVWLTLFASPCANHIFGTRATS